MVGAVQVHVGGVEAGGYGELLVRDRPHGHVKELLSDTATLRALLPELPEQRRALDDVEIVQTLAVASLIAGVVGYFMMNPDGNRHGNH